MKSNRSSLYKELQQAGAKASEIRPLLMVARQLKHSKSAQVRAKRPLWRMRSLATACIIGLFLSAGLIVEAQTSLPGTALYPVKRTSENVAVVINPSSRVTLMMRRAQEVNQLASQHADSSTILVTLSAYANEVSLYKMTTSTNYAAFAYCKKNLQQAATYAPHNVQGAIAETLHSMQDVD